MRIAVLNIGSVGILSFSATLLAAEPSSQWLSGVEVSGDSSYVYLGHAAPLAGNSFGNGFVRKLWVDWSSYQYEGSGKNHDVRAPGLQAAIGYQQAQEDRWWAAYTGLVYRDSRISPDDLTSKVRGEMLRPVLQLEGERTLAQGWKLAGNASYIGGQEAYWLRARVLRSIASDRQVGLEAIGQGDPDYRAHQFGIVLLGLKVGNKVDVGFKLGVKRVEGLSSQAYVGIELGGLY